MEKIAETALLYVSTIAFTGSLFIKWQQKTNVGQSPYRTLSLYIYGGGNNYLDRDMEKPGSSDQSFKNAWTNGRMSAHSFLEPALNFNF